VKHPARQPPHHVSPAEVGSRACDEVRRRLAARAFEPARRGFYHRIENFAALLATWGRRTNLTAHPDDPIELAFHIEDSLAPLWLASELRTPLARCFARGRSIADLGSGAGFPGLVLAAASDADFTLVEARRRRATFLEVASGAMELRNVTVAAMRAEQVGSMFGVVLARAFERPESLYPVAAAMLAPSGLLVLYASRGQDLAEHGAAQVGLRIADRAPYEVARRRMRAARDLVILEAQSTAS
jgi:16S rRNA (guanine527-N7)-methyltransferase